MSNIYLYNDKMREEYRDLKIEKRKRKKQLKKYKKKIN